MGHLSHRFNCHKQLGKICSEENSIDQSQEKHGRKSNAEKEAPAALKQVEIETKRLKLQEGVLLRIIFLIYHRIAIGAESMMIKEKLLIITKKLTLMP